MEPKFPLPVVVFAGTIPGEDVMARQIEELLLLTCLGAWLRGAELERGDHAEVAAAASQRPEQVGVLVLGRP